MNLPPTLPHWTNLAIHAIHVLFGVAALGLGLAAISSQKGGPFHIRSGRLFLYCYLIVILPAIVGPIAFVFGLF